MQKYLKYFVFAFAFLVPCALSLAPVVASAWSGPALPPPACVMGAPGCDAPINVGPNSQTKNAGSITLNSSGAFGLYTIQKVIGSDFCFYNPINPSDFSDCLSSHLSTGGNINNNNTNVTITNVCASGQVSTAANPCVDITGTITNYFRNDVNVRYVFNSLCPQSVRLANGTCPADWWSQGITSLRAGQGITLSPNPITSSGIISADIASILTSGGDCGDNKVLQGFEDGTNGTVKGKPICVEKIQCTGPSCPTPVGVTGNGTPGYLPKWLGGENLGDSIIREDNSAQSGGVYVGQQGAEKAYGVLAIGSLFGVSGYATGAGSVGVNGLGAAIGVHGSATNSDGIAAQFDAPANGMAVYAKGKVKIADSTQGLNKILASDANGLASWKDPSELEVCVLVGPKKIKCGDEIIDMNPPAPVVARPAFRMVSGAVHCSASSPTNGLGFVDAQVEGGVPPYTAWTNVSCAHNRGGVQIWSSAGSIVVRDSTGAAVNSEWGITHMWPPFTSSHMVNGQNVSATSGI